MSFFSFQPSTALISIVLLTGCTTLPSSGPPASDINSSSSSVDGASIQVVEVDAEVTRRLQKLRKQLLFSEVYGTGPHPESTDTMGVGDALEVHIWEAPPATLFGGNTLEAQVSTTGSRATTLPEQVVDREGFIVVPFAGRVPAAGRKIASIEAEIIKRLAKKSHQPEVLIRRTRNRSATVAVVGDVTTSVSLPLTPGGERLLDALAAAGGVRQAVSRTTLQITRGNQYLTLPLDTVIRDPRQNITLKPGDVITAMFQPLSFTALGATGKNEEINFEAQGITLAQALARAGGLLDSRSDAQGVFIFRFEPEVALPWPKQPVVTSPDGMVPVVYRLDLKKPSSFFVMQSFAINNKDIVYVSNSPAAEIQKFLNLVLPFAYQALMTVQVTK
ncbi:polysaccharide biosynthesis/export family protein [Limnohabitans sp. MMS-10A-178]|uniref:polysaccharide biosynthesis/export family protein n=1 Tax=Limnohabitans sp. MMS-10A-178 TaxID=1835767 RepID=UPI000D36448D|nr:polysaccharide biosynthesis/export family protein [Limnohabitans sp. MMS-10A-178]PUE16064.1 capsular biosynthesis protein [Limnohabitans sp. MMS-10A-178]